MPVRLRLRAEGFDQASKRIEGQGDRSLRVLRDISPLVLDNLREGVADFFRRQAGPDGPWEALAQSTVRRKGHGRILSDSGRLEASLTGRTADSIVEIARMRLVYGTRVDYAQYHERGQGVPRRGFMPYGEQVEGFVVRRAVEHILGLTRGSLGGPTGFSGR